MTYSKFFKKEEQADIVSDGTCGEPSYKEVTKALTKGRQLRQSVPPTKDKGWREFTAVEMALIGLTIRSKIRGISEAARHNG